MPPKKAKEEEIDVSKLPPWFAVNCALKCLGKKSRMAALLQAIKSHPKSFQKNISRDDIIEFAKEKGLYTDPNSLNEKQKKDPKLLETLNLEINASLIAKSFAALRADMDLKGRKAKKDKLEGKEEVDDKKVDPKKKDTKKDAKKGGKPVAEVVVEEEKKEEVEPEKEYKKAIDAIYFLFDFPSAQDEVVALSTTEGQVDLCFEIKEKVLWNNQEPDLDLLEPKDNFDEDLKQRMDDFIDGEEEGEFDGEEGGIRRQKQKEVLDENDLAYIDENRRFLAEFKQTRASSGRDSSIRRTVVRELVFEIDPSSEEESIKQFIDYLIEEICAFSFDALAYAEWTQGKKQVPLCPKEALKLAQQHEEEEKQRKHAQELAEQAALEEAENLKKKGGKKEAKKETKGKDGKKEDVKSAEELAAAAAAAAKLLEEQKKPESDEPVASAKDPFYTYYRQLNEVKLEKTTAGILLECLLDEIESEKQQVVEQVHPQDRNEIGQISSILDNLTDFVQYAQSNVVTPHAVVPKLTTGDKNTSFKDIIDECDEIEKRSHNAHLANRDAIAEREQAVFSKLLFPGIDRNLMPEVPEKSEALRKAEKSQLYPFISCNVHEFERRLTLTRFEDMLREVESERTWDFGDRVLMERHNRNTLMQTLYKALLWEPTVFTKYNDKDDSLHVAMYYKNPPGRILRKKWNAEWKVFPNMENWINYFKNSENNMKNEVFYDIDYERIGNVNEKTKYMFPNDNSLIFGTKFQLADKTHYRYKVLKEGVTFGIKEFEKSPNFWALFDNNTQLFVELEGKKLASSQHSDEDNEENQQHLLDEQAEKQAALTLTLVNGLVVKFLPNGDVFQTKVEQDKRSLIRDFEDIVNPHEVPKANSEIEIKRIVTGKGSVIKYMKDGSILVLYANGNVSFAQSKTGNWITTNNKGLRKSRNAKDGSQTEYEAVPCAKRTDPESGSKITIRADQTTIVTYRDGTVYTKHKDGTQMLTSPAKDLIIVEHPDYSTVRVRLDEVKARTDTIIGLGSAYANVGFDNLFERSNNGVIVETYLPDGSKVVGYREKRELPGYNQYTTNQVHVVYLEDGSVAKVVDNGEVVLVSGVDRVALNHTGEQRELGQDIDYWLQLFSVGEERRAGVYTADLTAGSLWTKDDEGNIFNLCSNGDIDTKIAVSLNLAAQNADVSNNPLDRPGTPDFNEGEFIEEENKFLPQPQTWVPVRLFTINNDNTGYELHSKEQVKNYFRLKEEDKSCIRIVDEQVPNFQNCTSLTFISSLLSLQEKKQEQIEAQIPRNLDIIPHTEKKKIAPERQTFLYRNFLEFDAFTGELREQHKADMEKYDLWKKEQTKQSNEFGVVQKSEEERDAEFSIQLKILESRRRQHREQTYDDAKLRIKEAFLPRVDLLGIGTVKQVNYDDLTAELEEPPVEQEEAPFQRTQQKTFTQIQRDIQQEKSKKRDKQMESQKTKKRSDFFVSHYFDTFEGELALNAMPKDIFNPVVMKTNAQDENKKEMDELKRRGQEIEADLRNSTLKNNSTRRSSSQEDNERLEDGSPVVRLEAEQNDRDPRTNTRTLQQRTMVIKPSVFTQRDIDEEKMIIEDEREALRVRKIRTKEYNVYGAERRPDQTKKVPCLVRTNPLSELNQKYILTDSITENRVKMSSMASRIHLNAPSISELRKAGTHQALAKTLDKKYNLEDLENKKNLMITADLNDQLRKDIQITPASSRFGVLCTNRIYETKLVIKNEDVLAQRVVIKQPQTHYVKVFQSEHGPIPMGLSREVIIRLNTSSDIIGKFHEEFQIISKHQIYRIPIFANIVDQHEYDELEKETKELHNKPLLKTFVKEIEFNKRRGDQKSINDSQTSDLFPKLHGFDKNYKIDPTNNMNKQVNQHDSFDQSFAD